MKIINLVYLLLLCQLTFAQQSDYNADFKWIVNAFESNDAGYPYYLKQIGAEEYARRLEFYKQKIAKVNSEKEYVALVNEWLYTFRKGHIGLYPKNYDSGPLSEEKKTYLRNYFHSEPTVDYGEKEYKRYLNRNKKKLHPIEGTWECPDYKIGIVRSKKDSAQFDAFIIQADSVFWMPKQKKATLHLLKNNAFDVLYFSRTNGKTDTIKTSLRWIGNTQSMFSINNDICRKKDPAPCLSRKDSLYIKFMDSKHPYIISLTNKTLYLRIPSFKYSEKKLIDSLLTKNDQLIRSTPNLIIDIRNGTGGSDYSHYGLIPYYYTQPIRLLALKYRASELNAKQYERTALQFSDSTQQKTYFELANKIRANIGGYYDPKALPYLKKSHMSTYPGKIAIVSNNDNASADEGFLYQARQSYKVKIFGKPTVGAFDFANVNIIDVPGGKYVLWLSITMSDRIPQYRIDDIGIQPDYFIDDSIADENWVDYVQSVVEAN